MTERKDRIIGPEGNILGAGDKLPCELAMARASNESRQVYDAWYALCRGDRLPSLADWDAAEPVADLQSSLLLVEILPGTENYRYLRLGPRAAKLRGYDPTGKTVRDIYQGDALDFVLENYALAIASPSGIVDFSIDVVPDAHSMELETLFLPLADDHKTPSHVLVYGHYITK